MVDRCRKAKSSHGGRPGLQAKSRSKSFARRHRSDAKNFFKQHFCNMRFNCVQCWVCARRKYDHFVSSWQALFAGKCGKFFFITNLSAAFQIRDKSKVGFGHNAFSNFAKSCGPSPTSPKFEEIEKSACNQERDFLYSFPRAKKQSVWA
jgi:hypothetical protein